MPQQHPNDITPNTHSSPSSSTFSLTSSSSDSSNISLNSFTIYHENVRSVMKKRTEILLSTKDLDYDCISINETWLHPSHSNSEFINEKYNVFRKDRKLSDVKANRGGGVLLAVQKKYDCEMMNFPEIDPIEAVCIRLALNSSFIYTYSLYIRNRLNTEPELTLARYKNHITAINALKEKCSPKDTLVVLGDFNLPSVEWMSDSGASEEYGFVPVIGESNSVEGNLSRNTTSELLTMGLHQLCNFKNHAGNVLDLAYTNIPELVSIDIADMTLFPDTLRDPAHRALICTIECEPMRFQSNSNSNSRYCFNKANYEEINNELNGLNFEALFANQDIDSMVSDFYSKLSDIFQRHVPQATPKNNKLPCWYNKKLLNLRNVRSREFKKLQNHRLLNKDADQSKFLQAKANFDTFHQELYTNYVKTLTQDRNKDPKTFWRFINGKRASNSLPSKLNYNGKTATSDIDKANLLAEHLSSAYINHNTDTNLNSFIHNRNDHGCNTFCISEEAVLNSCSTINISKGAGPDKIPPIFIRNCAESLVKPLTLIYSKSIADCQYPKYWKMGQITPIWKNGSKNDVKNYRGVNVLSNFAKLFETIVYNQLKLIVFPKLSSNQHGFRPNKNINTNLLEMNTIIHDAFENKHQVDIFYADISKAFDAVNHSLLIRKIAKFPLGNSVLRWFLSYLGERQQVVKVGSSLSNAFDVPSSVGQGSVLGPALFLIFFDDSDDDLVNSFVFNFADDKKIVQVIKTPRDAQVLQDSINKFMRWCAMNGLAVNSTKCKVMTFSQKKVTIHTDYYINNEIVPRTDSIRDLGVMFDPKLKFSSHIEFITNKAYAMLAFVKRNTYKIMNAEVAKMLYYALVRSNLEFANVVWSPYHQNHINVIESIQKQFVKFIHPDNSAKNPTNQYQLRPYIERCKELDMETLQRRRINSCILLIFDIISGRINSPFLREQLNITTIKYFTRQSDFIKLNSCRLNCTNNASFRTSCKLYNTAALLVDTTTDRNTFMRRISRLPDTVFSAFYNT